MAATYNATLNSLKDHIRLALGDTPTGQVTGTVDDPLLQDETIQGKLVAFGYAEALAQLAEGLITLVGQRPSSYAEQGGLKVQWAERVQAWRDIVDACRNGRIRPPTLIRQMRPYVAVDQTTMQKQAGSACPNSSPTDQYDRAFRPD